MRECLKSDEEAAAATDSHPSMKGLCFYLQLQ